MASALQGRQWGRGGRDPSNNEGKGDMVCHGLGAAAMTRGQQQRQEAGYHGTDRSPKVDSTDP